MTQLNFLAPIIFSIRHLQISFAKLQLSVSITFSTYDAAVARGFCGKTVTTVITFNICAFSLYQISIIFRCIVPSVKRKKTDS